MKLFKKTKKGFTLVELVVVIAVIAILSAVSVGAYFGITDSANNSRLEQEAEQIHTAIQAVSLGTDSNQSLGKDGLRVKDLDEFEKAIEKNLGVDVEVVTGETTTLKLPTIVLGNQTDVFAEHGAGTLYSTFGYLNPEIGGKKIVADVVSGDTKIVKYNFTVDNNMADIEYTSVYWKNPVTHQGDNTYVYVEAEGYHNGWTGTKMDVYDEVADIYTAQINAAFTLIRFHNGDDEGIEGNNQWSVTTRDGYSTETPYWDGDSWEAVPAKLVDYDVNGKTVYFDGYGYTEPRLYAWSVTGSAITDSYADAPAMTRVPGRNDFLYSFTFDSNYVGIKIYDAEDPDNRNTGNVDLAGFIPETNDFLFKNDSNVWGFKEVPLNPEEPVAEPSDYDIVGKFNNVEAWNTPIYMQPLEGQEGVYFKEFDNLKVGDLFKIRFKQSWENGENWGYSAVSQGADVGEEFTYFGFEDSNIKVEVEGPYVVYFDSNSETITYDYKGTNPGIPVEAPDEITIYVVNVARWEKIYAHQWPTGGEGTTWPGTELTETISEGIFVLTIDINEYQNFIINNGNGIQSGDISIAADFNPEEPYISTKDYTWSSTAQEIPTGEFVAEENHVYLKPNSNWTSDNAWFAIYLCNGSSGEKWIKMDAVELKAGYYCAQLPDGFSVATYQNIIFCRMNPASDTLDWSNKWTQTGDLNSSEIINGNNCFTINNDSWDAGTWGTI